MSSSRLKSRTHVCIGASTGGTEAVKVVLQGFPADMPPVLIVQHMPEMFTGTFAKRLDSVCAIHVKEAVDGERVQRGTAYIAPGHSHLSVRKSAGQLVCVLERSDPVNRHRPSVDVLFRSAARELGDAAVGVLLTGMGKDGADGLLQMHRAGAWTIAQDEGSSVVYGMPREAVALGAANEVLPLGEIASHVMRHTGLMWGAQSPKEIGLPDR
ncbi:MAG: CheB methylesterase domain-containing protein [Pseudazoarcus pumilus]|nr:CheB methylesterase domain-containing protein [Pseudazoarcus pumilus]